MSYTEARIEEVEETKRELLGHIWKLKASIQANALDRAEEDQDSFSADVLDDLESDIVAVLDKEIDALRDTTDAEFSADYYVDMAKGN
jgi:hypothetical protein